jgi:hypothetical protein
VHRRLVRIAARGTAGAIGCAVALGPWAPGRAAMPTVSAERVPADPGNPVVTERNKVLAVALMAPRGWSERQWKCLDHLWTRESSWNHLARNRWSGAYGIPQALPGSKMSRAGTDWRTSAATQIRWGLAYIGRRYGTPCAAWGHSEAMGWY